MAVTPIAIHVDHHVPAEFLPKLKREQTNESHRDRIVPVHVKNRNLDHLGDVRGIHGGTRIFRQRGEADLIVDHGMDGPARAVAGQLRHVQGLSHNSLAGKGRIAMDEQRQNLAPMFHVTANALSGAGCSFHHGIDRFKMARIGRQPNLNLRATGQLSHAAVAKMVFHVTVPGHEVGNVVFRELSENNLERFAQQIRQHIETPAMGHAHANLGHPGIGTFLQNRIQDDHQ